MYNNWNKSNNGLKRKKWKEQKRKLINWKTEPLNMPNLNKREKKYTGEKKKKNGYKGLVGQ